MGLAPLRRPRLRSALAGPHAPGRGHRPCVPRGLLHPPGRGPRPHLVPSRLPLAEAGLPGVALWLSAGIHPALAAPPRPLDLPASPPARRRRRDPHAPPIPPRRPPPRSPPPDPPPPH